MSTPESKTPSKQPEEKKYFECPCGSRMLPKNKASHEKSKTHRTFLENLAKSQFIDDSKNARLIEEEPEDEYSGDEHDEGFEEDVIEQLEEIRNMLYLLIRDKFPDLTPNGKDESKTPSNTPEMKSPEISNPNPPSHNAV